MKKMILLMLALPLAVFAEEKKAENLVVEKTMSVVRCQAVLKDGTQCEHQAEAGKSYCWRHHGAARTVQRTVQDIGKGTEKAWQSTKEFSTNAWQKTKQGAKDFWEGAKERADEARVGMVELFGGKDAKDGKEPVPK